MSNENATPRVVGGYEIRNSVFIGDKELLLGVNMNDSDGKFYMTCYAERNFILEVYKNAVVSDNFLEIADIFSDRLKRQVRNTIEAQDKICNDRKMITSEMCKTDIFSENLIGKILVVNTDALRPEYRTDINQIIFCKGGNGASPNGHGMSIYADYLATGIKTQFDRSDILGELKPEHYPEWAEKRIAVTNEFYRNENVFEYGGKHFLAVGVFPPKKELDFRGNLWNDRELNFKTRNGDKRPYTYRSFIDATKGVACDVFRCYENGKLYVPGENELFGYTGKFTAIDSRNPPRKEQQHTPTPDKNTSDNSYVFTYGGLHFVGIGQLPTRNERSLKTDIMHEPEINNKIKNYSYDKFMKASKFKNCDIYMCLEDGKKYIPGINKMLQYTGEHKPLGEKPQLKVRPPKEAER